MKDKLRMKGGSCALHEGQHWDSMNLQVVQTHGTLSPLTASDPALGSLPDALGIAGREPLLLFLFRANHLAIGRKENTAHHPVHFDVCADELLSKNEHHRRAYREI